MIENSSSQRTLVGVVVSDKMEKTLVVEVSRTYRHERLHKVLRSSKRYKVHYAAAEGDVPVAVGDTVEIVEGRPVSKTKYMYFTKVITRRQ